MSKRTIIILVICAAVILILVLSGYDVFDCQLCGETKVGKKISYTFLGTEVVICKSCRDITYDLAGSMYQEAQEFIPEFQQDLSDMFQ